MHRLGSKVDCCVHSTLAIAHNIRNPHYLLLTHVVGLSNAHRVVLASNHTLASIDNF